MGERQIVLDELRVVRAAEEKLDERRVRAKDTYDDGTQRCMLRRRRLIRRDASNT